MPIIISQNGRNAQRVDPSSFESEDDLQRYIYENPDSIPLYEIKEDIRLLIVSREFATPSGPIDAVGIDKDGDLYLVETKLYKNPDKRTVVAQVLDYGASLWRSSPNFSDFLAALDSESQKRSKVGFHQRLSDFFGFGEEEVATLLEALRRNLNEGRFKFVVLMDRLHPQLKDLIVFLNQNSKFDLFAVEMEYYRHEHFEILIPKLFGAEVRKDLGSGKPTSTGTKWDESSFFEDARKKLSGEQLDAVRRLHEFSLTAANQITWGSGIATGSFSAKFAAGSGKSVYAVFSDGKMVFNFAWLNESEAARLFRDRLRGEIERIDGLRDAAIPERYPEGWKYMPAERWSGHVNQIVDILARLVNEQ